MLRWGALVASVSCPLPEPVDSVAALKKLREVQQRRKALSPAAQERMAAREMGTDLSLFRAAIKSKKPQKAPAEVVETFGEFDEALKDAMTPTLRGSEVKNVRMYTEGMARYYNFILRSVKGDMAQARKSMGNRVREFDQIMSIMKPLPKPAVTYRGVNAKMMYSGGRPALAKIEPGTVLTDHGFLSTTIHANNRVLGQGTSAKAATNPNAFDTIMEIRMPKGTKAAYIERYSAHKFEQELVVAPGTQMRVVSVTKTGKQIRLVLEVIP